MNDAPPYSPTATADERGHLPHDFTSPVQEEEDPLNSLRRWKTTSPTLPTQASQNGGSSYEVDPGSASPEPENALRTIHTGPPTTLELPPDYTPVDALAHIFRLDAPLVYADSNNTPRYQLMQEFTRSGKPRQLHIRRLMAAESRSFSLPSASLEPSPRMRYDQDGTMYTISNFDLRGLRSSTLGGSLQLETGKGVLGGKWTKIWLVTKNTRRDSLNPENDARLQKYGYHEDHEWDKRLLFYVKKGFWEDGQGKKVAAEAETVEQGRTLEIFDDGIKTNGPKKDLVVSCWAMRIWKAEGMRWANDWKGW